MIRIGPEENKITMYTRALPITLAALLSLQGCSGGGGEQIPEASVASTAPSSTSPTQDSVSEEVKIILDGEDQALGTLQYTPIALTTNVPIETLRTELEATQRTLISTQTTIGTLETQRQETERQITTLSNTLQTQVTNLPSPIQVLVHPSSTETQKETAVTSYLGTSLNSAPTGTVFLSNNQVQTITPIHLTNPNTEVTRLSSKISQFQTELTSLETTKNTAYTKYQTKYQEYLTAKQTYDQSKANAVYWKAEYDSLKNQIAIKVIEKRQATNSEESSIDAYNAIIQPNTSNYSVQTGTYSSNIQAKNVSQITFSYRGHTVSSTFNVQSTGKFPGTLKVVIDGDSRSYTINSLSHLQAMVNILPQRIKTALDVVYYHKEVERLGKEIDTLTQKKDEAYTQAFTEILVAYADQSMYQDLKIQYESALASYNTANANFQIKNTKANEAKTQLTNLGTSKTNLTEYTIAQTTINTELTTARNEESRLTTLVSQKQQMITSVELGINNGVTESLGKIILNYWTPGTLSVSINLELYPNSTMEYKNGYSGGVFKNRNGILIQTNEVIINQSEYNNFPFILKVKFNRVENGNDFPALVWAEYKESSNSNTVYSTERYIANNKNDIATLFARLTPVIKERINLMQYGYREEVKNKILTEGNPSESIQYISTLSHNKVIDYLTNVQRASTQYMSGFGTGTLHATQETYDMMIAGTVGTIHGLSEYGTTVIDSFVYWEAKIAYGFTGDPMYQSIQRTVSNNIMTTGAQVVDELNALDDELKKMKDDIVKALGLINTSVENPEYWGGYINGYLSVLATESATITVASKSAGVAINALKASSGYIKLQRLIAKINVAGEIYKTTFKRVDLDILSDIIDPLEGVLGEREKIVFPRLFSLADKYDINPKTYVHIVNGEWNDNGTLKGGLHHMKEVEELLKDGKIKVALPNANEYESVSYTEYMRLDDTTKANIRVKGANDLKKWSDITKKTLFPSAWTEEDIAQAIAEGKKLITTGNNGKLVLQLDETIFIQYAKEGGVYNPGKTDYDNLFKKFKDGGVINLGSFGPNFGRYIYTYNGVDIKLGSRYVNGYLEQSITTVFPK